MTLAAWLPVHRRAELLYAAMKLGIRCVARRSDRHRRGQPLTSNVNSVGKTMSAARHTASSIARARTARAGPSCL